jgi:hypothetical protein
MQCKRNEPKQIRGGGGTGKGKLKSCDCLVEVSRVGSLCVFSFVSFFWWCSSQIALRPQEKRGAGGAKPNPFLSNTSGALGGFYVLVVGVVPLKSLWVAMVLLVVAAAAATLESNASIARFLSLPPACSLSLSLSLSMVLTPLLSHPARLPLQTPCPNYHRTGLSATSRDRGVINKKKKLPKPRTRLEYGMTRTGGRKRGAKRERKKESDTGAHTRGKKRASVKH